MANQSKARTAWVVGGILVAITGFALWSNQGWRDFEWQSFAASFREVQPQWLLAAVACVAVTYLLRAIRWSYLMRPIKADTHFPSLFSSTIIGFGAIALLGRAGEFVRPYLISRSQNVPVAGQISIWLLERLLDMLMILLLGGLAISSMDWGADAELAAWAQSGGYAIVGGTVFLFLALFVLPRHFDFFKTIALKLTSPLPTKLHDNLEQFLARLGEGLQGLRDFGGVVRALGTSALMWFILWLAFDFLLRACLPQRAFAPREVLVFMGLLMIGSVMQVPGIGGGVQLATIGALTRVFGVESEPASVAAIVIWLATFMVPVPPALLLTAMQGMSLKSLRQLESEG